MKEASLFKKTTIGLFISMLLVFNTVSPMLAYEIPEAPEVPQAPETLQNTNEIPEAPTIPSYNDVINEEQTQQNNQNNNTENEEDQNEDEDDDDEKEETSGASANKDTNQTQNVGVPQIGDVSGEQDESHGDGDNTIKTGSANASALLINDANANTGSGGAGGADEISVGNSGNGANSNNSAAIDTSNSSDKIQINNADVANGVGLDAVSGQNDASHNVGDSSVITGDSNATATVINGVNTNIDGVEVVQFNIDDTHTGDIVLAFPENTSSCSATICNSQGNASAQNTGNGAGSDNNANINSDNENNVFQVNDADVVNDVILVADSGHNDVSYNTGGDSYVETGDANAVATVGNFVNNNISQAGEVLIAVVNIFGDLIGNILLPESTLAENGSGSGGTTVANVGNGANSDNNAGVDISNTGLVDQNNNANVGNNINVAATTGDNSAENNTAGFSSGDNVIETGDASIDVNVVTIANNNVLDGATWWLVFVNDASGNWVGKIMGAPDGANMAGSAGTEFVVNPDGSVVAKNTGNGAGSDNNSQVSNTNSNTISQNNNANITNNITLAANSGHNDASYNTGGSSTVKTGDANVMANIINFVNNNFVGGKVVVSVVNVFGNWFGSFVPAGQQAPQVSANIGGPQISQPEQQKSSGNNDSGNQNKNSDTTSNTNNAVAVQNSQGSISGGDGFTGGVVAGVATGDAETNIVGIIENDDFISVPETPKIASANTFLSNGFWKIVGLALSLLIVRTGVRYLQTRGNIIKK